MFEVLTQDSEQRYPNAGVLADEVKELISGGLSELIHEAVEQEVKPPYLRRVEKSVETLRAEVGETLFHLQSIQEDLASELMLSKDP